MCSLNLASMSLTTLTPPISVTHFSACNHINVCWSPPISDLAMFANLSAIIFSLAFVLDYWTLYPDDLSSVEIGTFPL
jgi:hypothetical protein